MKIKFVFLSVGLLLSVCLFATPPEEGKSLFMTRCAACHNINKPMTGPALSGVHERRSAEWIIGFVRSSQTMIKNGDTAALALFEKFNKVPMPDHPDLTEADIKNIVDYIKAESKPVEEEKAPFAKPGKKKISQVPLSFEKDAWILLSFLVITAMLAASLLFAVQMKYFQLNKPDKKTSV